MTGNHTHPARFSDGRLDPFENSSHLVLPDTRQTLCAEPIGEEWETVPAEAKVSVNCRQCHTQRYWLPAEGRLVRDVELERVIEPWPAGERKHVTGDHDPARGRFARPKHLQLCLICHDLRGPFGDYDNTCPCDRREWHGDPLPIYGDLINNVHLCKACLTTVVQSGSRWSPYYCTDCQPAVQQLRRMAGRSIVPYGPHSLMNGIGWRAEDGKPITSTQAVAFADQLNALFAHQHTLEDLTITRTASLVQRLGLHGHAVLAHDFLTACQRAGLTPRVGFTEFIAALTNRDDPTLGETIWQQTHPSTPHPIDSPDSFQ